MKKHMKIRNHILVTVMLFVVPLMTGCKEGISNPISIYGNILCYEKSYNNYWEIFKNNLAGNNPINISNYSDDDEYPQWSPDGRYIVFRRSIEVGGPLIIVYDLQSNTYTNLTADGGMADYMPQWTPDGKVCFAYQSPFPGAFATYIMNPDGSEKRKILDTTATIYFYQDCRTFLYALGNKLYKTNIERTFNDFIVDLTPDINTFMTIRDFNPMTGELLVNTNMISGIPNAIAKYNIETRQLNLVLAAEENYLVTMQRYSKDYSKIVFIETNTKGYDEEYLSIVENGVKRRLLKLINNEWFDYNPMQFSNDNKYIAFSKNIYQEGDWVSWISYLYIMNIENGDLKYIDKGFCPSWKKL